MNKKKYKQLDQKERDRIYLLKEKGLTNSNIAKRLGRNKSTIGREIKRNTHQKFHQFLPVMCTHIWRFSEKYEKIGKYVYKITRITFRGAFKMGFAHYKKRDKIERCG
ncbi:hypothetical protein COX22_03520 [Candidatus Falkowbacteria bacterium CG23_combo_of_CG06-09_8_20_14_all_49_15]|uniref:Transposase IS30-like HTH domain-containing protein n=1 Tax=Candidatus Falkowbacteria bacterium CG23_combo_of_CG06-09_8_20_14_all_49_15 TaxID=1974572 RepID=A0A2G9ZK97_9BACT|nr:MAG: hypothetical protein COX22_03520 [Candidatus Falkowbacteria bacterium CG23_combo_of_CG06-09_8_20_14_all_49_15]